MEHRYAARKPVNEPVELWHGNEIYGEFETDNMCSGGVFVKNCQVEIGSARLVTIKFSRNSNLSYKSSYDAIVVHKADNGVGFKWTAAQH